MAALSDQLLVVAIFAYLIAMVCHAAEYAFGNRGLVGRTAVRRAPARELVGAAIGGVDDAAAPVAGAPVPVAPAGPTGSDRTALLAGRAAVALTGLGLLVHLGVLVTRGIAADRMPLGNMYEFILSATFVGVIAWLVLLTHRPDLRHLGIFVVLAEVLLLGVAGLVVYSPIVPLVPALNSYWFVIHITSVVLSSGLFLLGAVPAIMFLIRNGYEQGRRGFPYQLGRRAPAAVALERLTFRVHTIAFPIWTFGALIAGPIWAEAAWGRYWGWDPKEIWAFVSWVVYAGYLHARATPSVKRNVATWLAVLGFVTMLMNLFGVNLFMSGLHSYAGVE
ncbi:c-type cytochrome biogenesis protein CcsB [Micromonospora zhanjiangensis]|uniref:C-type cytochrome biogenesis protein CcsB n=1 Tax=Micromonospora zhanjiangensis TaxID=1522057 RepID=A0ABV8KS19_9ACTN